MNAKHCLAMIYYERHDMAQAYPLYIEIMRWSEQISGPDHPETVDYKESAACALWWWQKEKKNKHKLWEARTMMSEVVTSRKAVLSADHADTLRAMDTLASMQIDLGDLRGFAMNTAKVFRGRFFPWAG